MSDPREEKLAELLVDWQLYRQQHGGDPAPEDLCSDCPELVADLQTRIAELKQTDWIVQVFERNEDEDDDTVHLPFSSIETVLKLADLPKLPTTALTIDEFRRAVVESGLITVDELDRLQADLPENQADNPSALARELVRSKRLTPFQAEVLLEGRDQPLILGDYVLLEKIGEGGMGQVFRAEHRLMKRIVALKELPSKVTGVGEVLRRFQREIETVARLAHPNIVVAYDAGEDRDTHYLITEYVDGTDLAELVQCRGPFSVANAIRMIRQAAEGLRYAHSQGVVHRDVKPSNLMLDRKGAVKLLDLGLARFEIDLQESSGKSPGSDLTAVGKIMGTVAYMAPEQAEDTRKADQRSDIYSLGCVLYYLLTGKPVFEGDSELVRLLAHRDRNIPSLAERRPDVPAALDRVFIKMLAKRPHERYPTIDALLTDLEELGDDGPVELDDFEETTGPRSVPSALEETAHGEAADTTRTALRDSGEGDDPKRPRRGFWGTAVALLLLASLLGGAYVSGILLRVRTEEGTVVLEYDQPEVTGAAVAIDGNKAITITRKNGNQPVTIEVPEGRRQLKVTKAGFETFTREFAITSGGKKVIRVSLEPESSANGGQRILDDGDIGYSETGTGWQSGTFKLDEAYGGDYRFNGAGAETARWTFPDLEPGWYEVFATWTVHPERAHHSVYNIYDHESLERRLQLNHQAPPDDERAADQWWENLGTFAIENGSLVVELDTRISKGGAVMADAVRLVFVKPLDGDDKTRKPR